MKIKLKFTIALAMIGLMAATAGADIAITSISDSYTQDFNTLPNQDSGTFTWIDNSTLDGWYRRANVNNEDQTLDTDLVDYAVKGGNVKFPGFYNASTAGNPDRAVGFRINGAPGGLKKGSLGIIFENNTGETLTGFDLAYTGEQWFKAPNDTTLLFQWRVVDSFADINNDIDVAQEGWNDAGALSWSVPAHTSSTWSNGTENTNSVSGSVSGMSLAPGQKLVMRWRIPLTGVNQNGLFIDDVTVTNWVSDSGGTSGGASALLYADWVAAYQPALGLSTNLTDDPDGDAVDNLTEYALFGDPTDDNNTGITPTFTAGEAGGTNYFDYVYYKWTNAVVRGLSYEVELTDTLSPAAWTNSGYQVIEGAVFGYIESVTNRIPVVDGQKSIRLKISYQ